VVQREPVARNDEPTGEPESLAGRIDPRQMGSLGGREKPSAKERKRPHETIFDPKKSARLPT
jgi:pre-mRNA-splicing helicase BRR2